MHDGEALRADPTTREVQPEWGQRHEHGRLWAQDSQAPRTSGSHQREGLSPKFTLHVSSPPTHTQHGTVHSRKVGVATHSNTHGSSAYQPWDTPSPSMRG